MSIRTDTCVVEGNFGNDQTICDNVRFQVDLLPSILSELSIHTIRSYKFDVEPTTQTFVNRRIFAFVDTGVPDGVNVDELGNVYSGCGDGVHVGLHLPTAPHSGAYTHKHI